MALLESCPACGNKNSVKVLSAKDYTVSDELFDIRECSNCTLRFTQNIPDKEKIGKYYQSENYISHSDTAKGLINNLYHKVRSRTLITKRNLVMKYTGKAQGKVLDIGSGTGAFLHTMDNAGWDVTGLEPDETARVMSEKLHGIVPQNAGNLYTLNSGYDAITLWHVLEHVHDLHEYMEELKRLLNPGGKIFVAVPNYTSYDAGYYQQFWAAYDVPRHLYHFSPTAMKKLFIQHGLVVSHTIPMWYDSVYVSMLSEQYKTGHSNPLKGGIIGGISNLKAAFNKEKCSSIIYIGEVTKRHV
jgi:2-polyprenyl-3-methyl-5-hydroxy-6-metoxy-1,4-benzoquinol methylase